MTLKTQDLNLGRFSNHSHKLQDGDHLVHFYENQNTLLENVGDFMVPPLTTSQGAVIIIATAENIEAIQKYLESRSLDVLKAKLVGQLVVLDEQATLNSFMTNRELDVAKFRAVIGSLFSKLSQTYSHIRAY